jgi:hypothetical protein
MYIGILLGTHPILHISRIKVKLSLLVVKQSASCRENETYIQECSGGKPERWNLATVAG